MGTLLPIFLAVVGGYVVWITMCCIQRFREHCRVARNFPTMEPCHPILGHLPIVRDMAGYTTNLIEMVQRTRVKVVTVWMMFQPLYTLVHPDSVKEILRTSEPKPKGFGQAYGAMWDMIGDGLLVSDGSKWERNRKLLTPAFHLEILRTYVPIYNEAVDILLNKFEKQIADTKESFNITESLGLLSLDVILRCALSYEGHVQEIDNHPYAVSVKEIGNLFMKRMFAPWKTIWCLYMLTQEGRNFRKHANYMTAFASELITKRRQTLTDDPSLLNKRKLDFLDIMITAQDDDGVHLTDQEVLDEVRTFLFEGHDTTASALNWQMYCLAKYPEEQEKVHVEVCALLKDKEYVEWSDISKMQRLTMFIKETLRMYTPVAAGHRILTKPREIDGVILPVGSVVSVYSHILHHHPDVYPDPMVFNPERFLDENCRKRDPYAFIPFMAGPRNCIGQGFTLNEQKVIISRIVKRFRILLDVHHSVILVPEITSRPKYGIKVRLEPR